MKQWFVWLSILPWLKKYLIALVKSLLLIILLQKNSTKSISSGGFGVEEGHDSIFDLFIIRLLGQPMIHGIADQIGERSEINVFISGCPLKSILEVLAAILLHFL